MQEAGGLPAPLPQPSSASCQSVSRECARGRPAAATLQPGKCLYTTIRELVENGLDSAESISQLPDLCITV